MSAIEPALVRPSPIAGKWYPGSPDELRRTVEGYLERVPAIALEGELLGLIAPHAGIMYSGQAAAYAYSLLRGRSIRRVLLLGPDHRNAFHGVLATDKAYYETPLGLVPVETGIIEALARHLPVAHVKNDLEHSLEMQLPFLQVTLGTFSIIPLMLGNQSMSTVSALVDELEKVLDPGSALIVASSDLSHYYDSSTAFSMDRVTMQLIEQYRPEAIVAEVEAGRTEACGYGAIAAGMLLAKRWGANRAQVLHRSDSGAVTGDNFRVVGYLAAAIVKV